MRNKLSHQNNQALTSKYNLEDTQINWRKFGRDANRSPSKNHQRSSDLLNLQPEKKRDYKASPYAKLQLQNERQNIQEFRQDKKQINYRMRNFDDRIDRIDNIGSQITSLLDYVNKGQYRAKQKQAKSKFMGSKAHSKSAIKESGLQTPDKLLINQRKNGQTNRTPLGKDPQINHRKQYDDTYDENRALKNYIKQKNISQYMQQNKIVQYINQKNRGQYENQRNYPKKSIIQKEEFVGRISTKKRGQKNSRTPYKYQFETNMLEIQQQQHPHYRFDRYQTPTKNYEPNSKESMSGKSARIFKDIAQQRASKYDDLTYHQKSYQKLQKQYTQQMNEILNRNEPHDFKIQVKPVSINDMFNTQKQSITGKMYILEKLAKTLSEQVDLDKSLKDARCQFKQYNDTQKWNKLSNILRDIGRSYSANNLQKLLDISSNQIDPFPQSEIDKNKIIKQLSQRFISSEQYWEYKIPGVIRKQQVDLYEISASQIDLNCKGYLNIEDLVCFINLHANKFFRNRDLITLYKRFISLGKDQKGISYTNFMDKITK